MNNKDMAGVFNPVMFCWSYGKFYFIALFRHRLQGSVVPLCDFASLQ